MYTLDSHLEEKVLIFDEEVEIDFLLFRSLMVVFLGLNNSQCFLVAVANILGLNMSNSNSCCLLVDIQSKMNNPYFDTGHRTFEFVVRFSGRDVCRSDNLSAPIDQDRMSIGNSLLRRSWYEVERQRELN